MKKFDLYAITIEVNSAKEYVKMAQEAILGGANILQIRDKHKSDKELFYIIKELIKITRKHKVPLIVNNRFDIAFMAGADGVHVGQDDVPHKELIRAARKLDKNFIIGISTHSLKQAVKAEKDGASYIAIGPVWGTPTKPDYKSIGLKTVKQVIRKVKIPVVAIGGIDKNNVSRLIDIGVKRVAVVRAVCGSENIKQAAKNIKLLITNY